MTTDDGRSSADRARRSRVPRLAARLATVAVPLLAAASAAQPGRSLLDDVRALEGRSNAERVEIAVGLLEQDGLVPVTQEFEHRLGERRLAGRNVVVGLGRKAADDGAARLVVGAHIDVAPLGDGAWSRGAVDNAAGSALVMRLAGRLAEHTFARPVDFVLFDLEERAFGGSKHYLEALGDAPVAAMVNVDIATSGSTVIFGPATAPGSGPLFDLSLQLCAERRTDCVKFPRMPPSDERSFIAREIPAISFAVVPAVEARQLWLLLNGGKESGLKDGFLPRTVTLIHTPRDGSEHVDEASLQTLYEHLERYVVQLDRLLDSSP